MRRFPFFAALILTGCSQEPDADLQYISKARSLGAEWALVNEQANAGKLTSTYTLTMRNSVREELQTTSSSLTVPNSAYGEEIRNLIGEPDNAAPAQLRAHVDRLKQFEDRLESA